MIYKKLLGIFYFLFLSLVLAQAQAAKINGLIVIDFKDEHPEGVLITNRQTKNSVLSDLSGSFKIEASVGDTLYFKGSFLEDRKLAIKAIHFKYNPLIVHMNQEVIKLEDIVVRPPLTGDLERDIASVEKREAIEKIYDNLGIDIRTLDMEPKEKIEDVLPTIAGIPIPTSVNIGALVKSMNGYYRKLENLRAYDRLDDKLTTVKEYFGEEYFRDEIGIDYHQAREFLLFIYGKEKQSYQLYYKQKDFLSIDQMMRKYAPMFKQRLQQSKDSIQIKP